MLSVLTGCIWIVHTWTVVGCHDRKYGRRVCTLYPWLGLGSIFRCGVAGGHTSVPVKSNWQAISIIPHSARPCQYRLSKHQPAQYFPTEEFLPDGHFEHEPGSLFVSRILNGENGWKLPNTKQSNGQSYQQVRLCLLPLSLLSYEQHIIDKNVHKMGLASSPAQHLMYGISLSGVSYHGEHFEGTGQRCCYDHAVVFHCGPVAWSKTRDKVAEVSVKCECVQT